MKNTNLIDNQIDIINQYILDNKAVNIFDINKSNIKSSLQYNLLDKYHYFGYNLKFHTEEEMEKLYGFTFNDLNINKLNSDLFKLSFLSFLCKDNPNNHTKDYVILKENLQNPGHNKVTYSESTFIRRNKILQTIGNDRAMIIPIDKYYSMSDQEREEIVVNTKYGVSFSQFKEIRDEKKTKSIQVIAIEIDLHDMGIPQTEEEKQNIIDQRTAIKETLKTYDLPGTVNYTTNRSIYMQYTLSHPVKAKDAKLIKKVLAHRVYEYTGLNADLANMSHSILHHAKLTKHVGNNMTSIVAPYLWYDMPYNTGAMLRFCKKYVKDNNIDFNEYFQQTPQEKQLTYLQHQLQTLSYNILRQNEIINDNFTNDSLHQYIQTLVNDTINEIPVYGFNKLFNTLAYKYINYASDEKECNSFNQQCAYINQIIDFLKNNNLVNIRKIYEDIKTIAKIKMAYNLNNAHLKQIETNIYSINNYKLQKTAYILKQNTALMNLISKYNNLSFSIIEYCKWFNDFLYPEVYQQACEIELQADTLQEEETIQKEVNTFSAIIEAEWKDGLKLIKTNYSLFKVKQNDTKIITSSTVNKKTNDYTNDVEKINNNNAANYQSMCNNILSSKVIPSNNFKIVYEAIERYKNNTFTQSDLEQIRQIFDLAETNKRELSSCMTYKAILRELGNKLHNLCTLNLATLIKKSGVLHQFYHEDHPSMTFNIDTDNTFAKCKIEYFYSYNDKPSGSIIDLITWCFADKQITYYEARSKAVRFLARVLNINISNKEMKKDTSIFRDAINETNELFNKFILSLNKNRSKKSTTSINDLTVLKDLIISKLVQDSFYDNNKKMLKQYNNKIDNIVYSTQTLVTTAYLKDKLGWSKNKCSYLMGTLLRCNLFQSVKNRKDIADSKLRNSLNNKHNIPFIFSFTNFKEAVTLKNNKKITNYTYTQLCMQYIFSLEKATHTTINNWTQQIKDTFDKITTTLQDQFTQNNVIIYEAYNHQAKHFIQVQLDLCLDLIQTINTSYITANIYDQKNKLLKSIKDTITF